MKRNDYFQLNEKDFNWEEFLKIDEGFLDLSSLDLYSYVLESFEKIKSGLKQDIYKIVLHNGLNFELLINFEQAKDSFKYKLATSEQKHYNTAAKTYKEILSKNITDNDTMCIVMFRDEQGRVDRTGEVKMASKELFVTVRNAISNSWSQRDYNNIKAIMMRVDSNDTKRLSFYKELITRFLPDYKIFVEDRETEANTVILYAVKN
jgi:hypothetical protein